MTDKMLENFGECGKSAGKECEVHDFIVGTEAHENATTDKRFKQFLILTALEAIEKQRNVELDRSKIDFCFKSNILATIYIITHTYNEIIMNAAVL